MLSFEILALTRTLTLTLTRTLTLTSVLIFEILAVFCLAGFGFRRWRFGYELGPLTLPLPLTLTPTLRP